MALCKTDLNSGGSQPRASFWLKCTTPFSWGVYEFSGGVALSNNPVQNN